MHLCARCRYSGVLSAYGLALADVVEEVQEPCSLQYEQRCFGEIDQRVEQLSKRCCDTLRGRGFSRLACRKRHMVQVELSFSGSVSSCLLLCQSMTHSHYVQTLMQPFLSSSAGRYLLRFSFTCDTKAPTVLSWSRLLVILPTRSPVTLETSAVPSPSG